MHVVINRSCWKNFGPGKAWDGGIRILNERTTVCRAESIREFEIGGVSHRNLEYDTTIVWVEMTEIGVTIGRLGYLGEALTGRLQGSFRSSADGSDRQYVGGSFVREPMRSAACVEILLLCVSNLAMDAILLGHTHT